MTTEEEVPIIYIPDFFYQLLRDEWVHELGAPAIQKTADWLAVRLRNVLVTASNSGVMLHPEGKLCVYPDVKCTVFEEETINIVFSFDGKAVGYKPLSEKSKGKSI